MSNVSIVVDSTAFIDDETIQKYKISVVPLYVNFENQTIIDGSISPSDFFEKLADCQKLPTTSQPSHEDFLKVYKNLLEKGQEIITLVISSDMSGTYESALRAAKMVDKSKVEVFDSKTTSGGLALLAIEAAKAAAEGKSKESIMQLLNHKKSNAKLFFIPETLEYLKKGGRIGRAQALVGNLLKIKPVLFVNDGKVDTYTRLRTMKKAVNAIIEKVPSSSEPFTVIVLHANDCERANYMKELIIQKHPEAQVIINGLSSVIATHVGPKAAGIAFWG